MAGQGLESLRADETLGVLGHRHLHLGAGIAQAPHQVGRLVRGDAAAHAEQEFLSVQVGTRVGHRVGKTPRRKWRLAYLMALRGPMPAPPARHHPAAMHIRDWPADERPREKLLARGATALSDAELLAIFLGSGLRGRDAVGTARDLLNAHGPLRALLERSPSALANLPGLGPARACALAAALELGNRHLAADLQRGEPLTDPAAAGRYFASRNCSAARSMAPRCIRARSPAARSRTTPRR